MLEVNYDGLPFTEDDFQFDPPMGFKFLETNPIVSPDRKYLHGARCGVLITTTTTSRPKTRFHTMYMHLYMHIFNSMIQLIPGLS